MEQTHKRAFIIISFHTTSEKKKNIKCKENGSSKEKVATEVSFGFNYETDFSGDYKRFSMSNKFMIFEDSFSRCIHQAK
jgi:hypothetical protein